MKGANPQRDKPEHESPIPNPQSPIPDPPFTAATLPAMLIAVGDY